MGKLETLWTWLKTCPIITSWLYVNAVRMENNNVSLNPISDNVVTDYVNGSAEKELVFSIDFVQMYDLEQSEVNLTSIESVQGLAEWIAEQTILPNFGTGFLTTEMEVLEEVPNILADSDIGLCKYQFQARVLYLQL